MVGYNIFVFHHHQLLQDGLLSAHSNSEAINQPSPFKLRSHPPTAFSVVQHFFARMDRSYELLGSVLNSPFLRCDYITGFCKVSFFLVKQQFSNITAACIPLFL
jgi:hypothetical protein